MLGNFLAIDTETTGLYLRHGCRAFMVTACSADGDLFCWHFRINPLTRKPIVSRNTVDDIIATVDKYPHWVFHNSLFDMSVLSYLSPYFNSKTYKTKDIHDTMIMAHTHRSNGRLGLKPLSMLHLSFPEDDEKELHSAIAKARRLGKKLEWAIADPSHPHLIPIKDKDKKFCDYWLPYEIVTRRPDLVPDEQHELYRESCRTYALKDVERTIGLASFYKHILDLRGDWNHYDKHRQVIVPTWEMQNKGFPIKTDKLPLAITALEKEKIKLVKEMTDIVGDPNFNPASGPQIAKFLFEDNDIQPVKYTASENPSTDKVSLKAMLEYEDLPDNVAKFISYKLTHTSFTKSASAMATYAKHSIDGRLFGSLKIPGTKTLRFSMQEPNTQNVSKLKDDKLHQSKYDDALTINLRNVFGPKPGYVWFCIDYTQLQLRIFAQCCRDQFLIDSFARGDDAHNTVAKAVFEVEQPDELQRRAAKGINFGIIFGAGKRKIESMTGIPGSYEKFKERFPLVDSYITQRGRDARRNNYVRTLGGYPLQVERKLSYKACNIEVQGTEGELVKQAIVKCNEYLQDKPLKMIMVIHDELILESEVPLTPKEINSSRIRGIVTRVQKYMNEAAADLGVYTTTDVKMTTTTWAEAD